MPTFRFNKARGIARAARAFFNSGGAATRRTNGEVRALKERLKDKRREKNRLGEEWGARKRVAQEQVEGIRQAERNERRKKAIELNQEIFQLERELLAAKGERAEGEWETGALPDFVVIGAQKGGTGSFFHLLIRHPHVEPAAVKELHYFDNFFEEEDVEWYRGCFPKPRWKDGHRTVTGEATPKYMFDPPVARRMAEVAPQARLIALLRNPVDRAYSHYHHQIRNGVVTRSFQEAIEAEEKNLRVEWPKALEDENYAWNYGQHSSYLARGLYADQLLRWSKFFGKEQMLVLKSEDFFRRPADTLKLVCDFLGLPDWEPDPSELGKKRNSGKYEKMDPATRRWLEDFFEPHNQRLYEYLGTDLGW